MENIALFSALILPRKILYVIYKPWLLGVYNKHTTLVLSHRKFTIDKPLGFWPQGLSMANFL